MSEPSTLIREPGGLVYLPHPFDMIRRGSHLHRGARARRPSWPTSSKCVNGRSLSPRPGGKAGRLARGTAKPEGAGSDAHRLAEVGRAYVWSRPTHPGYLGRADSRGHGGERPRLAVNTL